MKEKKSIPKGKKAAQRTDTADLNGIPVIITRKRMKSLRLRILPSDLSVRLSVPIGVTEERVMLFLSSKEPWIRRTLDDLRTHSGDRSLLDVTDTLTLWGIPYRLETVEEGRRYSLTLSEEGYTAVLRVPVGSTEERRREHLRALCGAELERYLSEILPRWEAATGLRSASHDVRYMKSRWGSCNPKTGHIRMNLRLVSYPRICTDYVLLHELCHLAVPNHGADFKALLDSHMPTWRQIRKALNGK